MQTRSNSITQTQSNYTTQAQSKLKSTPNGGLGTTSGVSDTGHMGGSGGASGVAGAASLPRLDNDPASGVLPCSTTPPALRRAPAALARSSPNTPTHSFAPKPLFYSPVCQIQDADYASSAVQRCELSGWADLEIGFY